MTWPLRKRKRANITHGRVEYIYIYNMHTMSNIINQNTFSYINISSHNLILKKKKCKIKKTRFS